MSDSLNHRYRYRDEYDDGLSVDYVGRRQCKRAVNLGTCTVGDLTSNNGCKDGKQWKKSHSSSVVYATDRGGFLNIDEHPGFRFTEEAAKRHLSRCKSEVERPTKGGLREGTMRLSAVNGGECQGAGEQYATMADLNNLQSSFEARFNSMQTNLEAKLDKILDIVIEKLNTINPPSQPKPDSPTVKQGEPYIPKHDLYKGYAVSPKNAHNMDSDDEFCASLKQGAWHSPRHTHGSNDAISGSKCYPSQTKPVSDRVDKQSSLTKTPVHNAASQRAFKQIVGRVDQVDKPCGR